MTGLYLATTNSGKVAELRAFLQGSVPVLDAPAPAPLVVEDGTTYFENALKKAVAFQRAFGGAVLADDSGLEVDALEGRPGIHSARYGGDGISWPERWVRLLKEMEGATLRTARFRCVLCYYDGQGVPVFFEGTVEGEISRTPKGGQGFGYDPLFFCPELGKTFGEASPADKDRLSHRTRALRHLVQYLDRRAP